MAAHDLVIDLTDPQAGTLGDRIRRVEGPQAPDYGTLGYRMSLVGLAPSDIQPLRRVLVVASADRD